MGVHSLVILNSPNLTNVTCLPEGIISLSLDDVGVTNFDGKAISEVSSTLKVSLVRYPNPDYLARFSVTYKKRCHML